MDGPLARVGVIHDFPPGDGGASFEWAVRLGFADVGDRLPAAVEFVHEPALGLPLPGGSEHSVVQAFEKLVDAGCVAILGPAITDNALIATPLADQYRVPCINYAGDDEARSEFMFHFQIGSLEEEPAFLVQDLVARGLTRIALIQDPSHIAKRMSEYFEFATAAAGAELSSRSTVGADGARAKEAVDVAHGSQPDALAYVGLWNGAHEVALARRAIDWDVPSVANSALIYGHHDPSWARDWEGWTYADTVSDANPRFQSLTSRAKAAGMGGGPGQAGAYDMGRLLAEGMARASHLTRAGVRDGLERVKVLESATGEAGTLMGFGNWDRGALKGRYLVLRDWRDGTSVGHERTSR